MSVLRIADRYVLLGELGRGGTATVHLAVDERTGERVALKVVHPHLASTGSVRARLQREVAASKTLSHPGLLVASEVVEDGEVLALRLAFHPGVTLAEQVATSGPLTDGALSRVAEQLASALSAAHRAGIVHRDVTPFNVLLDRKQACLTDFGLARIKGDETVTRTSALGTPGYAAPEVLRGERASPQADLYGLGATLFLAATGRSPFNGSNAMAILSNQLDGTRPTLRSLRPDLPEALCAAIDRLLCAEPSQRPAGARGFLDALDGALGPQPVRGVLRDVGLRPGDHYVVVSRLAGRKAAPTPFEQTLSAAGESLRKTVLEGWMGVAPIRSNEARLTAEVALVAGFPPDALRIPTVLGTPGCRLVSGVDLTTATTLSEAARQFGYHCRVVEGAQFAGARSSWMGVLWAVWAVVLGATIVALVGGEWTVALGLLLCTLVLTRLTLSRQERQRHAKDGELPVAFPRDLTAWLTPEYAHYADALGDRRAAGPVLLADRAAQRVADLARAVDDARDDLPRVVRMELRDTLAELQIQVAELGRDDARLSALVADSQGGATAAEVEQLTSRIARLKTLVVAGETQHAARLPELEASLALRRDTVVRADALDDRRTALSAQLLDVIASVDRARHDLFMAARTPYSGRLVMERLKQQVNHAQQAHDEMTSR